jgi:hypothetical protein
MTIRSLICSTVLTFTQHSKENQLTSLNTQSMKLNVLDSLQMVLCNYRHRNQAACDESCCSSSNCCLHGVHFQINPVILGSLYTVELLSDSHA